MTFEERIERCLDKARPYLRADGGDVAFRRFSLGGVVELQWLGTCAVCPMSQLTLRAGVERAILQDLREVKRVEAVTS